MTDAPSAAMLTVEYHLEQIFKEALPAGREIDDHMLRLLTRNASPEMRRRAQERQAAMWSSAQPELPYGAEP